MSKRPIKPNVYDRITELDAVVTVAQSPGFRNRVSIEQVINGGGTRGAVILGVNGATLLIEALRIFVAEEGQGP